MHPDEQSENDYAGSLLLFVLGEFSGPPTGVLVSTKSGELAVSERPDGKHTAAKSFTENTLNALNSISLTDQGMERVIWTPTVHKNSKPTFPASATKGNYISVSFLG